ncbi:MAG: T9SS type A sorting domain-containing protein, partial [Bacteroidales bacterium]|nr:T9SS type A sorting domain-containing protein [Bacteroidales bacterium]
NNNSTTFNEFASGNIFTISTTYVPNNFDWEGNVSTAWENGDNWSGGSVPSGLDDITITTANPNEPTVSSAAECNALALANGRTLTVSAGNSLTLNGDFSFNGTLILKSPAGEGPSASFIDNGTITGTTGTMRAERFLSANKFHYVSSPIQAGGNAGSDLFTQVNSSGNFNPNFYYYDETVDLDGNPATAPAGSFDSNNLVPGWTYAYPDQTTNDPMEVKTGYAFWSDENTNVTFIGDPNTGDININGLPYTDNDPVAGSLPNFYDGWNLIANPYPSAIDWDLAKGERTNLDDGIYVWDGAQYASYAGGVQGGSTNLTNEIAPMQAFFVHATANPGSITLKNTHRVHSSENYLKAPVDENNESIPYFIRLKMQANGYSDYTVVYFKSNATSGFDGNFDAYKLFSNLSDVPHIYSMTETDEVPLSINSMHHNSMQNVTVPLIVKIGKAGNYSISLDAFNFENHYVYFIDNYKDVQIELNNETLENYSFSCDAGELSDRFELRIFENHAPSVEGLIPDMEIPVSEFYTYTFGENVFVDLDLDDKITYTAQLDNGSELPAWLIFNAETRTFSGTPESIDVLDINVTATDKLGESATESFVLTVSGNSTVGYISDKIEIYPNPTSNFIFVKQDLNSGNNSLISITDITGKIIYKTKINSNIFRINVSDYTAGTYFVKIQTGTKILREKIVIQK